MLQRDLGQLAYLLSTANSPADIPKIIIFSQTKDDVYTIFSYLHSVAAYTKSVAMYHASQSQETKAYIQSSYGFTGTELRCISATIAFGMVCVHLQNRYTVPMEMTFPSLAQGMDINDVEAVIVNGPPDTLAQLYQVITHVMNITYCNVFLADVWKGRQEWWSSTGTFVVLQKAGRESQRPIPAMFASLGGSENCRRRQMLRHLRSTETVASGEACCDICSGRIVPSARLDILVPTPVTRSRKPEAVRFVSSDMRDAVKIALVQERNNLLEEFPGYKMVEGIFILSDKTIAELCALAPSVTSVRDLNSIATLWPEHKQNF